MPSIGPAPQAVVSSNTQAAARTGARPLLVALGAAALGTAAWLGLRALLHGDEHAPAADTRDGAAPAATPPTTPRPRVVVSPDVPWVRPQRPQAPPIPSTTTTTAPPTTTTTTAPPPPIATEPGPQLQQLVKHGPRDAASANDPAAFRALLGADGDGWQAADGTLSIPLPDGQNLWLFGDTMVQLPGQGGRLDFVRNSAILQRGNTATTLVSGTPGDAGDFLTPERPGEWYWPGSGIAQGDELVLFMSRLHETAGGAPGWNFEGAGTDMLVLDLHDLSVKQRVPMPGGTGMDWGSAVVDDGQHTYVYGFKGYADDPFRRESVLARTTSGGLGHAGFEYWNGSGWTGDPDAIAPVQTGLSNSYSAFRLPNGRWAMASQELFFGTKLQVSTADRPEGPWSPWQVVDDGPTKAENQISYNAQVHPQFTADGKLLASWNMNLSSGQLPGPGQFDGYRPQFRAIPLDRIDGAR